MKPRATGVRAYASHVNRSISLIPKIPRYLIICVDPAKRETIRSKMNRRVSVMVCLLIVIDRNHAAAAETSVFQNSYKVLHCFITSSTSIVLSLLPTFVAVLSFSVKLFVASSSIERSFLSLIWISLDLNFIVLIYNKKFIKMMTI